MADPNSAPVGSDSGTLTEPDFSQLQSDLSQVESQYEPRIQKGEEEARGFEQQAVSAEETVSQEAEREAGELTAEDEEMQHWVDHTPTRQAAYATGMHAAPALAILTALGGKFTKLNGMQMLAATNGIVQGINESSEQKYNDAMAAWQSAYEKMRQHQQRLMDAHKLMLTAYQGRADAYQKASDAARRMTGDILDDKQRQAAQKIDRFKAQVAAWEKIQRVNTAHLALKEKILKDIAQESHWKELEKKAANMPPEIKAQLAAAKARWQNAKAQTDENMKRRGETVSSLTMSEPERTAQLAAIDEANERLRAVMDAAQTDTDSIVDGFAARAPSSQLDPNKLLPPENRAPNQRAGVISGRPEQPGGTPPQNQPAVAAPPNVPPTNAKGWVLHHDTVHNTWAYVDPADSKNYEIVTVH
jgi:hypothetical protein